MKPCPTCEGRLPRASPGHCVDIDGGWWHEPGSCKWCNCCDPICLTCHGVGLVRDPLVPRDRGVDRYAPRR